MLATAELYRRQGMTGTGLKQIARAANAPFGSIYHFFPGGKTQLTDEVIRTSGRLYRDMTLDILRSFPDLPSAIEGSFAHAAEVLEATDYADACPIATIALEVASTDDGLRRATAEVFTDWIDAGVAYLEGSGLPVAERRRLMLAFVTSLEGAFVLSRALRATEPLRAAGSAVLATARAALS
ncbi:MAG: TetR/AcrR family transcriptional regulator [Thermocrispum sp.]